MVPAVLLLQLVELALADVAARIGLRSVLHDARDGLDAGRAGKLFELAELVVRVDRLSEHGKHEPALELAARRGVRLFDCHERPL